PFVSGNWAWINQVMDPLGVPRLLQASLFAGAIAWEALGAVLFWWAAAAYRDRPLAQEKAAVWACGVNLALWPGLQVVEEVFLRYPPGAVHRVISVSHIATLLLLQLLPSTPPPPGLRETDELRAGAGPGGPGLGSRSE